MKYEVRCVRYACWETRWERFLDNNANHATDDKYDNDDYGEDDDDDDADVVVDDDDDDDDDHLPWPIITLFVDGCTPLHVSRRTCGSILISLLCPTTAPEVSWNL